MLAKVLSIAKKHQQQKNNNPKWQIITQFITRAYKINTLQPGINTIIYNKNKNNSWAWKKTNANTQASITT